MISSNFLIVSGIITGALGILALIRCYKEAVPIHWLSVAGFILVAFGISYFYYEKAYGLTGLIDFIMLSRVLWTLVSLTFSLLFISLLIYRR